MTAVPMRTAWVIVLCLSVCAGTVRADTELTVMSFNIWGGGANEGQPVDQTVAAIRAAGADIIGVQETRTEGERCTADDCPPAGGSVARAIAGALGFYYYDQTGSNPALWANAILSRFPLGAPTPNQLGIELNVGGRRVYAFNVHLSDSPYQPYQLLGVPYGAAPFVHDEAGAIRYAREARGAGLDLLIRELDHARDADAVFIFGDFNEPSWHDWSVAAAAAGRHPAAVRYPSALALEQLGFTDAYRSVYPDEMARPGFTWPARGDPADPENHPDRIDYVFARAAALRVVRAAIVGEAAPRADIVVSPWPSDHRAVSATVSF